MPIIQDTPKSPEEPKKDRRRGKPFWTSKTFWLNVIAVLAIVFHDQFGFTISTDMQAVILAVINMLLRSITHEKIEWSLH